MSTLLDLYGTWLVCGILVGACILFGWAAHFVGTLVRVRGDLRSVVRRHLMTSAELRFHAQLRRAVPELQVFPQVSMGALLRPQDGLSKGRWWQVHGRYSQQVVDFCLADATGNVFAVIELDDPSHERRHRRDLARDRMLARGGYQVIRFPTSPWPRVEEIKLRLAPMLQRSAA